MVSPISRGSAQAAPKPHTIAAQRYDFNCSFPDEVKRQ
jgi:hypothetical protein